MNPPIMMASYDQEVEEPGAFDIFLRFLVGSSGAITSYTRKSQHVVSATLSSAGVYKLVLDSFYSSVPPLTGGTVMSPVMDYSIGVIGTVTTTDGTVPHLAVDNMLNGDASGTPYVTVSFTAGADGTAANVKSGNEVSVRLTLKAHQ
jgi:hypothetical protein